MVGYLASQGLSATEEALCRELSVYWIRPLAAATGAWARSPHTIPEKSSGLPCFDPESLSVSPKKSLSPDSAALSTG